MSLMMITSLSLGHHSVSVSYSMLLLYILRHTTAVCPWHERLSSSCLIPHFTLFCRTDTHSLTHIHIHQINLIFCTY